MKRLSEAQGFALRRVADGENPFEWRRRRNFASIATRRALERRGLITTHDDGTPGLTALGRTVAEERKRKGYA